MMRLFGIILFVLFCFFIKAQGNLPDAPEFISASVIPESDPTEVVLEWTHSDSISVIGYSIYKVENSITVNIDDVYGRLNTSYTYSLSEANQNYETFRLASFDDDINRSKLTDPHSTIHLNIQLDKCNNSVVLNWTAYSGWVNGVKEYKIHRRNEDGTYEVIGTIVSGNQSYTDNATSQEMVYYYYIEAISNGGISATSNSESIFTESYLAPSYIYAQSASVSGENIILRFVVDNTAEVLRYEIQKSDNPDTNFQTIESFQNTGQKDIYYTDLDVDVNNERYYYKLVSLNPCGVISSESNISSNILLSKEDSQNLRHSFSWTDYFQWQDGVSLYHIYNIYEDIESNIGSNSSTDLSYSHSISSYVISAHENQRHLSNKFCYFVEATENHINNPTGIQGISRSNKICMYHEPVIWVPDAINPGSDISKNRVFKPVMSFIEREPYELIIMDRWGFEVFKTDKTYEGWDGRRKDNNILYQRYLYILRYYDYDGNEHQKLGSFIIYNK